MTKQKRKLTSAEKARKKKRQLEYMTIFINGKQKRVKRPSTIDGIDLDAFIQRNADPIWLHQNEMWEDMDTEEPEKSMLASRWEAKVGTVEKAGQIYLNRGLRLTCS
jgi:hypothetical protein